MSSTNKEYAIEMGVLESLDRILSEVQPGGDPEPELLLIRVNSYDLLVTLLEYDHSLPDIADKVLHFIFIVVVKPLLKRV